MANDRLDLGKVRNWEHAIDASPANSRQRRATAKPEKWKRRTFLLTPELAERIDELAEQYAVEKNALVRYALDVMMSQIESGEHELPVKEKVVREIEWEG